MHFARMPNALVQASGVNTINEGDGACSASPATGGVRDYEKSVLAIW